ncbi:hypothetical protein [Microbacterium sp. PAMC22086]|uniref:hypothetical protein n=1 Tax=Microbacterium sp. PAMC22086 TaxID=2861281 RepID=UPI001C62B847|nr:hypothetical protein [Microbacterium sp. PAMC22086]QYG11376.1 hypothetical protein KY497_14090 [Microbacterium sp. PAMC22086]
MSFGSDLDMEGFTRAFADHDIRPLLGLSVPNAAAEKIAGDSALLRNVYEQWKRKNAERSAPPARSAPQRSTLPSAPPQATAAPPKGTVTKESLQTMSTREVEDIAIGGGWPHVIAAYVLLLSAWVAMSIGFFIADDRSRGSGVYGQSSMAAVIPSLWWAALFTAAAFALAVVGTTRSNRLRATVSFVAGVIALVATVLMIVVIILSGVAVSTLQ